MSLRRSVSLLLRMGVRMRMGLMAWRQGGGLLLGMVRVVRHVVDSKGFLLVPPFQKRGMKVVYNGRPWLSIDGQWRCYWHC